MENLPIKVETKTIAFTDSVTIASDRITGDPCIIAFRATASKNGQSDNSKFSFGTPGI